MGDCFGEAMIERGVIGDENPHHALASGGGLGGGLALMAGDQQGDLAQLGGGFDAIQRRRLEMGIVMFGDNKNAHIK
jgi:hypothetical protein